MIGITGIYCDLCGRRITEEQDEQNQVHADCMEKEQMRDAADDAARDDAARDGPYVAQTTWQPMQRFA